MFKNFNSVDTIYKGIEEENQNSVLPREIETAVIGGGLSGLSVALHLAEHGREVVVIEAKNIADGPSGRSGGQLWPGFEQSYEEMSKKHGETLARSVWQMTHDALRTVHKRAAVRADYCDFKPGVLLTSKTMPQALWVENEFAAMEAAGMDYVTFLTAEEISKNYINTDYYLNGMLFMGKEKGQQYGHLNPRKLTQTVAKVAKNAGARLIENNPVREVTTLKDGRYRISTQQGSVIAKNIVMATGVDMLRPKGIGYDLLPNMHVPVQTVILATAPISEKLAREMIPSDVCFFDAASAAMNYGRLVEDADRPNHFRLTLGGADALGQLQTALDIHGIEREMRTIFPQLDREKIKIEKIWGGKCDLTRNAIPFIINPRKGFYATGGMSGQGMVNTTLYGGAIAEAILGEPEKLKTLQMINPEFYVGNSMLFDWMNKTLAWGQAAQKLIPIVYKSRKEESTAITLRKARRAKTTSSNMARGVQ